MAQPPRRKYPSRNKFTPWLTVMMRRTESFNAPAVTTATATITLSSSWATPIYSSIYPSDELFIRYGEEIVISKDGNRMAISAPWSNFGPGTPGKVFIYTQENSGTWSQEAVLSLAAGTAYAGKTMAIDGAGNRLIVDGGSSAFLVWSRDASATWAVEATLSSNAANNGAFSNGSYGDINYFGDKIVIPHITGLLGGSDYANSVEYFIRTATWASKQIIYSPSAILDTSGTAIAASRIPRAMKFNSAADQLIVFYEEFAVTATASASGGGNYQSGGPYLFELVNQLWNFQDYGAVTFGPSSAFSSSNGGGFQSRNHWFAFSNNFEKIVAYQQWYTTSASTSNVPVLITWRAAGGGLVREDIQRIPSDSFATVQSIALSPDGNKLFFGHSEADITLTQTISRVYKLGGFITQWEYDNNSYQYARSIFPARYNELSTSYSTTSGPIEFGYNICFYPSGEFIYIGAPNITDYTQIDRNDRKGRVYMRAVDPNWSGTATGTQTISLSGFYDGAFGTPTIVYDQLIQPTGYSAGAIGAFGINGAGGDAYWNNVAILLSGDGNYSLTGTGQANFGYPGEKEPDGSTFNFFWTTLNRSYDSPNSATATTKFGSWAIGRQAYTAGTGSDYNALAIRWKGMDTLTTSNTCFFYMTNLMKFAGDFTIESYVRREETLTATFFAFGSQTFDTRGNLMRVKFNGSTMIGSMKMHTSGATSVTSTQSFSFSFSNSLALQTWAHLALERAGDTLRAYADGKKAVNDCSITGSLVGVNTGEYYSILIMDEWYTVADHGYFMFQEYRITGGVARYGGVDFTPPSSPYYRGSVIG